MSESEIRQLIRDELQNRDAESVKQIIREELEHLIKTDRYTFQRDIEMFNGRNIILAKDTGTQIGTETDQKLAFLGATPIAKQSAINGSNVQNVSGTGDDTTINNNFADLEIATQELELRLQNLGLLS